MCVCVCVCVLFGSNASFGLILLPMRRFSVLLGIVSLSNDHTLSVWESIAVSVAEIVMSGEVVRLGEGCEGWEGERRW